MCCNCNWQMKPSAALEKTLKASKMTTSLYSVNYNPVKIGLEDGCPIGTVPIRRTTKEDLIRTESDSPQPFYNDPALDATGNGYQVSAIPITCTNIPNSIISKKKTKKQVFLLQANWNYLL